MKQVLIVKMYGQDREERVPADRVENDLAVPYVRAFDGDVLKMEEPRNRVEGWRFVEEL